MSEKLSHPTAWNVRFGVTLFLAVLAMFAAAIASFHFVYPLTKAEIEYELRRTAAPEEFVAAACGSELERRVGEFEGERFVSVGCSISEWRASWNFARATRRLTWTQDLSNTMPVRWVADEVRISLLGFGGMIDEGWTVEHSFGGERTVFTTDYEPCRPDPLIGFVGQIPCISISSIDETRWPYHETIGGWLSFHDAMYLDDMRPFATSGVTSFGRSEGVICEYWVNFDGKVYYANCAIAHMGADGPRLRDLIRIATAAVSISPCSLACYNEDFDADRVAIYLAGD